MMRRLPRVTFVALLLTIISFGLAQAQPPGPFGDDWGPEGEADWGDTKELLSTVYLMELAKELGLEKGQAAEIASIIEKEEKAKDELQETMRKSVREIRIELKKDKPDTSLLKKHIAIVVKSRDKMKDSAGKTRDSILAALSIEQQAKFIVFHGKWARKMHRIRDHIRGGKMRKQGRGQGEGEFRGMGQGKERGRGRSNRAD